VKYLLHLPLLLILAFAPVGAAEDKPAEKPDDKFVMTKEEKLVLDLTNAERKKQNLPPFTPLPILFKVARAHSANMAKQEKLEHVLDGKQPWQRVLEAGYKTNWVGENCAAGEAYPPKEVVKNWMDSEGHRMNILDKTYTEIGIGIVKSDKGEIYYTQVFTRPGRAR